MGRPDDCWGHMTEAYFPVSGLPLSYCGGLSIQSSIQSSTQSSIQHSIQITFPSRDG